MRKKFLPICFLLLTSFTVKAQNDSISSVSKLMQLSLEELMDIKVVSASGYLQTTTEAPSTIIVITAQQIAERGYEQLEDALRDVPGIDMIHINGYAPTLFYFRGMYGAENLRALLMIDGIIENNILGSNDMAGPAYSLHNADRIEIIWGPVSALYGANAFGGVINIITKKGADINGLHIESGFGSFNTRIERVSFGIRKSKFEFSIAGSLYNTDGPRFKNRDPQYSGSYVHNAYSINTEFSYYSRTSKTTLGFREYKTPMGWGTYSNSPTVYFRLPPQGNNNSGVLGAIQRDFRGERSGLDNPYSRTLYIQNEYKPDNKFSLSSLLQFRETGHDEDGYIYVTVDGRRMIYAPIASYSKRFSAEVSAHYSLSEKHRFSVGVEFNRDNVERGSRGITFDASTIYLVDGRDTVVNLNSTFLPRKYDIRSNVGGYGQYVLNTDLLKKTIFTFGFRFDDNSYFGNAFSPRIVVVNQPDDKWTFKLQYGNAFRSPTNLEIYQVPPSSGFKLKKENLKTYEVNILYSPSKNFRFQLNGFHNKLTDVIILGNLNNLTANKNPAVFKINGLELISEMIIAKNIDGFFNLTYTDAWGKNLVTGISGKLPAIAKIKGNLGFTIHVENFLAISLSENWIGERPVQRTNPYGPVDGYFLTNCVISTKKIFKERVTVTLNVRNIFNVKWLDPGFRQADGFVYSTVLEQPGINGLFKIGIDF